MSSLGFLHIGGKPEPERRSPSPPPPPPPDPDDCIVCMAEPRRCCLVPCGHIVMCMGCAAKVTVD